MSTTVINRHHPRSPDLRPDSVVYIGRGSKWGNVFTHQKSSHDTIQVATREEAVFAYEHVFLPEHPELLSVIKTELKNKILECFCKPAACHGDVLARIADED